MIPIQLTIEGLYSYQKKQTIDFTRLTDAGLFGIFGTVGSGKSSILEAITFALYGESERMNQRERRNYNMMNLKSHQFSIDFEFYNFENRKFKAVRSFRRNSKRFDDVKPYESTFYEFKEVRWVPLEHTNAEEIIGLTYLNFKRTIIIPQGQFKEFLELGASDRTRMMKEIFKLQKYDLQDKTSSLMSANKSNLDQIEGKLSGYESVSEEEIEHLKRQLHLHQNKEAQLQKEWVKIQDQFNKAQRLKQDFEKLQAQKIEFEKAENDKILMDENEQKLLHYEKINTAFSQLLSELKKTKSQITEKNLQVENQKKQLHQIEESFTKTQIEFERLKPLNEQLPQKRQQEQELKIIKEILVHEHEITTLVDRTKKGIETVEHEKQKREEVQKKAETLDLELKSLNEKRIDAQIIMNISEWFMTWEHLQSSKKDSEQKEENLHKEILQRIEKLQSQGFNPENLENIFHQKYGELQKKRSQIEEVQSKIFVQQQLVHYTEHLHDGQPCPLCGSLQHPHILEVEDVTEQLQTIDAQLQEVIKEEKSTKTLEEEVRAIGKEISFYEKQLQQTRLDKEQILKTIQNHEQTFVWKEFNFNKKEEFEAKKKENSELLLRIEEKQKILENLRKEWLNVNTKVSKYEQALNEFKIEEEAKRSKIKANQSLLQILKFENFREQSPQQIDTQREALCEEISKTEHDFQSIQKTLNDLNLKKTSCEATLKQVQSDKAILEKEVEKLNTLLSERLLEHKISSVQAVEEILCEALDITALRQKIQNFRVHYATLKNNILQLENLFSEQPFNPEAFQTLSERVQVCRQNLDTAKAEVAKLTSDLERLTKNFEAKKELLQEKSKLERRADQLKTLFNLFKGSGFVQYVSSIYLRQLCDHANLRFHRMTRNQLSLQLNDANEFEIVDYLNEGKTRSVKTLSGGQAFQVSLCLALALAESIQTNAQADKNFFFLDEGFGTQDGDSINIVFETLQSLQKENRIVGIISHVEELKERIPIALQVTKDEENGSIIEMV